MLSGILTEFAEFIKKQKIKVNTERITGRVNILLLRQQQVRVNH